MRFSASVRKWMGLLFIAAHFSPALTQSRGSIIREAFIEIVAPPEGSRTFPTAAAALNALCIEGVGAYLDGSPLDGLRLAVNSPFPGCSDGEQIRGVHLTSNEVQH